jgi:hypothetical protein
MGNQSKKIMEKKMKIKVGDFYKIKGKGLNIYQVSSIREVEVDGVKTFYLLLWGVNVNEIRVSIAGEGEKIIPYWDINDDIGYKLVSETSFKIEEKN